MIDGAVRSEPLSLASSLTSLASAAVLDESDSEAWALAVLMREADWRPRHAEVPFFSLGLAAYLDTVGLGAPYHHKASRERNNALIGGCFQGLLQRTAQALQGLLCAPMQLVQGQAALPGFHIYLPHPAFAESVAVVHRDIQYRQAFPRIEPGTGEVFSFTLPLCHPEGSGLRLWPGCNDSDRLRRADGSPVEPEFHAYRPGEIVVHDGLAVHQAVLGFDDVTPRISLQGHGLWVDGAYLLYW